ncbi:MAG: nitroreductase family protein [Candidatus Actinomarina sp.]|mgnify:FL=1|jgi:nitroreductase|uniref:Nitroreductase n=1 Tax=Candidatus Actinomarina minuta TaxID=1389454 RepID=S5DL98_9ACTN|nr:nitroreductase [Candidatus Actinomarina minuta]MDC3227043.1 nitroreductase family protein [Acidimicrobiaceae bacterium]|tara:strand:+ start:605 stop:1213 length:609 start_codon:yes stop_codon:yes gene_type:complete
MMRNENNHLKELLLNRRVVRNYLETNEEFPNLSDIPKLTIKIPTAGFSRGIEIISVENKKNIKKLAIYANEESYLKKGYGKWLSNSKAIFLILINEQAYHERYKELDKQNQTSSSNWSVPYWYVDAGAAMMNCMLLVEETGLKSGFLGSHNMEIQKIKSLLVIPEDIEILGFVTAGVEGDSANLKKDNLNKKKLLHKEKYAK